MLWIRHQDSKTKYSLIRCLLIDFSSLGFIANRWDVMAPLQSTRVKISKLFLKRNLWVSNHFRTIPLKTWNKRKKERLACIDISLHRLQAWVRLVNDYEKMTQSSVVAQDLSLNRIRLFLKILYKSCLLFNFEIFWNCLQTSLNDISTIFLVSSLLMPFLLF